ncbi:MAG: hypothetical protein WA885_11420 [Phormidesmis sp.]
MTDDHKTDRIDSINDGVDAVYIDLPLSYIHVEQETWENYYLASVSYLGWNKKGLLTQIASAFCSRHRDFLLKCADIEAEARGLDADSKAFFDLYADWTTVLPAYTDGQYPEFPASPLANVIDPDKTGKNRRGFANIRIGKLNAVLLRVLSSASRGAESPELLSRLTKYHFAAYKDGYFYQFAADDQQSIRPDLDK